MIYRGEDRALAIKGTMPKNPGQCHWRSGNPCGPVAYAIWSGNPPRMPQDDDAVWGVCQRCVNRSIDESLGWLSGRTHIPLKPRKLAIIGRSI